MLPLNRNDDVCDLRHQERNCSISRLLGEKLINKLPHDEIQHPFCRWHAKEEKLGNLVLFSHFGGFYIIDQLSSLLSTTITLSQTYVSIQKHTFPYKSLLRIPRV